MKFQGLILAAAAIAAGSVRADTWMVRCYGNDAFFGEGVTAVTTNGVNVNATQLKFPKARTGWSAMSTTHARIEKAGEYAFTPVAGPQNAMTLRVRVNGKWADECPDGRFRLGTGDAEVAVFARPSEDSARKLPILMFTLACEPQVALEAAPGDAAKEAVDLGTEFRWDDGRLLHWEYRTFEWTAPESGVYAFILHGEEYPMFTRLWADGLEIYESGKRGAPINCREAYWGDADKAGNPRFANVDYLGCQRIVRYLEKGRHEISLQASPHFYLFQQHAETFWRTGFRFGVKRLEGLNPDRETSFEIEGRDCAVWRAGEEVCLRVQSAADETREYTLETCPGVIPVGEGVQRPFRSEKFVAGPKPVRVRLHTGAEGAYVYQIRNARGDIVNGPWSYAVVDAGRGVGDRCRCRVEGVVVDSVDCTEGPGGPHDFRDNDGSSTIVDTPDGKYRLTGLKPLRWNHYTETKDREGLVPDPTKKSEIKFAANDWFAYTLKVAHPGKTHLLRCLVPNDVKRQVTVFAIDRKTGACNGWNLAAGEAPAAGPWSELGFFVWPNADAIDVLVVNTEGFLGSKDSRAGAVRSIELVEYPDGLPPLEKPFCGWAEEPEYGWEGEQVDIGPNERMMPPHDYTTNWIGVTDRTTVRNDYRDWNDFLKTWNRFGETSAWHGDNLLVYPIYSYEMLVFQGRAHLEIPQGADCYFGGAGGVSTDPFGRDLFALMLLEGEKHGVMIAGGLMIQRVYEDFVRTWINKYAPDARAEDVVLRTSAGGKPFMTFSGATIPNPAHPAFRRAFVRFFEEMGLRYGKYPAFAGIRTRFWPDWSASFEGWYHNRELGYDDYTVGRFSEETGIRFDPVGTNETAFAARKERIRKEFLKEFEDWKCAQCLSLREEALAALRKHAPKARLIVTRPTDEVCKRERGLDPDRLRNRRDLGFTDDQYTVKDSAGLEWNWPDPVCYANFNRRPAPYGNPPLDRFPRRNVGRYPMGFNCIGGYRSSPYHLEKPAQMLAENRLKRLWAGGPWCPPPADEALRRFVRVWRAIPQSLGWRKVPASEGQPVVLWTCEKDGGTLLFAVNTTDARRRVEVRFTGPVAAAIDQVTGESLRKGNDALVATLDPFMPAYWRVDGQAGVREMRVPFEGAERAKLDGEFGAILAMEPLAKGIVEYKPMSGTNLYAACRGLGLADRAFAFDDLLSPMKAARAADDGHGLRALVQDFRRNHSWWYEAFGWPDDFCIVRKVGRWSLPLAMRSANGVGIDNREVAKAERLEPWHETFVTVPQGVGLKMSFNCHPGGYRRLAFRGLFGGGYGPVEVRRDGRLLGTVPASRGTPRLESRVFALPLKWTSHHGEIVITGLGGKGLALTDCDVEELPSAPAQKGWVLGPFDHGEGLSLMTTPDTVDMSFGIESNAIDLAATYVGMGGRRIGWRTFDNSRGGRVIDMDRLVPSDLSKGNATAYVLVRVRNGTKSPVSVPLRYTNDYFSEIWVNGKPVVEKGRGPINSYDLRIIGLKPGVNDILVRTAPGSAGFWYLGLALLMNDDLEYVTP